MKMQIPVSKYYEQLALQSDDTALSTKVHYNLKNLVKNVTVRLYTVYLSTVNKFQNRDHYQNFWKIFQIYSILLFSLPISNTKYIKWYVQLFERRWNTSASTSLKILQIWRLCTRSVVIRSFSIMSTRFLKKGLADWKYGYFVWSTQYLIHLTKECAYTSCCTGWVSLDTVE